MDSAELLKSMGNFCLSGMLFYVWIIDNRDLIALQNVIKEQIEDKQLMHEDRTELIKIIREQAEQNTRIADALQRVEIFLKKV